MFDLRPVLFRYKQAFADGEKPIQFGLIAEEVAEIFPELVIYDEEGRPETVKYHLLGSMLLNELRKVHERCGAQDAEKDAEIDELARPTKSCASPVRSCAGESSASKH